MIKHIITLLLLIAPLGAMAQTGHTPTIGDSLYALAMETMPHDSTKALKLLEKGAKKGHAACCNTLGDHHNAREKYKKAAQWYEKAGDARGRFELGCLYLQGLIGKSSSADTALALRLIRSAERENYGDAIYLTARLFTNGEGVEQNSDSAVAMLKRLEPMNDGRALYMLGRHAEEGLGMERDSAAAFDYFERAGQAGIGKGYVAAGNYYRYGMGGKACDSTQAFLHYSMAAAADDKADGLYEMSNCYFNGIGTRMDSAKATFMLYDAMAAGSPDAAAKIGDFYYYGAAGFPVDHDSSFHYYFLASQDDHPRGDYMMGVYVYEMGIYEHAISYLQSAMSHGSVDATVLYAQALLYGNGVEQDVDAAVKLLEQTAPLDKTGQAHLVLGIAHYVNDTTRDPSLALRLLDTAASMGNEQAMILLGQMYNGSEGIERDTIKVLYWYERAVAAGNTVAMVQLGGSYMLGQTVPHNPQRAAELYKMAADRGNTEGMCRLGVCYEKGEGVPLDLRRAYNLYKQAAEQGSPLGMRLLAYCYVQGIYVEEDDAKAAEWFTQAAEAGDEHSAYILGTMYATGEGVKKSKKKARYWLNMAAEAGIAEAADELERL